ncbi:uncharacterized protein TRIADDRAFT_60450 [Trichoplax adhaerens]|uniref:Uncharacterized protein n=1 Tax=Trichoplax adhaerens TaxID=10228 RepID=B3S889_TRIAD|nr:predicted protein [Trichoplax adhaerens]EDV21060.1 predicted protein [Trichoplax adhaerens]|eukprot:XP_002116390.1 predicted protein [Trichoplax adhaerens]
MNEKAEQHQMTKLQPSASSVTPPSFSIVMTTSSPIDIPIQKLVLGPLDNLLLIANGVPHCRRCGQASVDFSGNCLLWRRVQEEAGINEADLDPALILTSIMPVLRKIIASDLNPQYTREVLGYAVQQQEGRCHCIVNDADESYFQFS